jgi:hypothetical protein
MHMRLRPVEDVVKEMHAAEAFKNGEKYKAKQIAKKMLSHKQPIEYIKEITGLSEKEILSLND